MQTGHNPKIVALLALLASDAAWSSSSSPAGSELMELDERSFEVTLNRHERVLVVWYTPWCDKCMIAMPKLEAALKKLRKDGCKSLIAKIDATVQTALASKFDIAGPVMHYFVEGEKVATYIGEEETDEIISYLKAREQPEVVELNVSQIQGFLVDTSADELSLVARVKNGSARHRAFVDSLASIIDMTTGSHDMKFGVAWLPPEADPKAQATLTMYREGVTDLDTEHINFGGAWSMTNIALWAAKNSFPALGNRFRSKYEPKQLLKLGFDGSVVFCHSAKDGVWTTIKRLITDYPLWKFTRCDPGALSTDEWEMIFGTAPYSIGRDDEAVIALIAETVGLRKYQRYVLEGEHARDSEAVVRFLADVKAGKARPRFRSEPRHKSELDENGVIVLTGATFQEHAMDPSKDLFVEFWHPRCDHCKTVTPVWDRLARNVETRGWTKKGLMIAKIDMSLNDCEEEVSEFPKFVLYPAVAARQKMRKRVVWMPPPNLKKYSDLPIGTWEDFLQGAAVNLEGEEDASIDAEVRSAMQKNKRGRARRELKADL